MIRRIVDLFLWFCVASILAQLAVLTVAAVKGNINDKTMARVLAALNGVDIQGERLQRILIKSREVPVPTYEDVLDAKVKSSLELDSRQEALDRLQRQITDRERTLREEINRFETTRKDFQQELDRIKKGTQAENLSEIRKILENLAPEQAKEQVLLMLKNNQKKDVVLIIKALPPDKQKKLLAEFTNQPDQQQLNEILQELKNTAPIDQAVDKAGQGLAGN
jgi:alanyl-tRNA synthetase